MDYKYYLILKKDRQFKVLATSTDVDVNYILLRYNASKYIELDVHTYFSYIYAFYAGNEQYFHKPGCKKVTSDTTTTMCH